MADYCRSCPECQKSSHKKAGRVPIVQENYVVEMPDRGMRRRVLHVNMLKKCHTPFSTNYLSQGSSGSSMENKFSVGERGRSVRIRLVG